MQGTPSPYPHPPAMQPGMGQPPGLPESFSQNPVGAEIGLWPLAWGWWGVIALSIVLLIALVIGIRAYRRNRLFLRMAIKEIQALNTDHDDIKSSCNQILKRTFMSYYPVQVVAKLYGETWSSFLRNQLSAKKQLVLTPLLESLGNDFYRADAAENKLSDGEFVTASVNLLKHSLPPSKKQLLEARKMGGAL